MSDSNSPSAPRAAVGSVSKGRKTSMERRSFFSWLAVGWVAFVGVTGGFYFQMFFLSHRNLLK